MRLVGGSGTLKMTPPFPAFEVSELPTKLIATILANIDDPHGSKNEPVLNVVLGIVQLRLAMTAAFDPRQFVVSVL
jgi:hypothetical protein